MFQSVRNLKKIQEIERKNKNNHSRRPEERQSPKLMISENAKRLLENIRKLTVRAIAGLFMHFVGKQF